MFANSNGFNSISPDSFFQPRKNNIKWPKSYSINKKQLPNEQHEITINFIAFTEQHENYAQKYQDGPIKGVMFQTKPYVHVLVKVNIDQEWREEQKMQLAEVFHQLLQLPMGPSLNDITEIVEEIRSYVMDNNLDKVSEAPRLK